MVNEVQEEPKKYITLRSSDDRSFTVDDKVAKLSETIKTMLDTLGSQEQEDDTPIPITNVTGDVLAKVVEWGNHHKDRPRAHLDNDEEEAEDKKYDPYEFDKDYKIVIDDWNTEFFKVNIFIFILNNFLPSNFQIFRMLALK